ncbi:MAG: response regulator, partial [Gammaproteobacteria bacterium]|nr:response regulator [Gammaproteobacteria bacterium]
LAAVRRLREGNYPGQIIMLTANATVEVKEACLKAGCNDFLTKPVERNYFRQTLINFLYPDNNTEPSSGYSDESLVSTLLKNEPSMRALVLKYVGELPILVEELRDAYEEKNWELLRFRLHDLKTTSGNYGFPTLSTLAAQTEFITLSRNIEKIEELLAQIEGLQLKITLSSQCDQSDLANQSMHQMHAHNQKRANE